MISFKQNKKKKNNSGFSLVEVLLAVVLLGLIAAPMLQMFYSSYAMNQKSKEYLAGADLLQSVMEGVSAQTWEDSKTVDGKVTIPGLKDYYTNLGSGTQKLYAVYKSDATGAVSEVSGAPTGTVRAKSIESGEVSNIVFENVSYAGYRFTVLYEFTAPATKNKYWSEKIDVTVYLVEKSGTEKAIQTASTKIANKR